MLPKKTSKPVSYNKPISYRTSRCRTRQRPVRLFRHGGPAVGEDLSLSRHSNPGAPALKQGCHYCRRAEGSSPETARCTGDSSRRCAKRHRRRKEADRKSSPTERSRRHSPPEAARRTGDSSRRYSSRHRRHSPPEGLPPTSTPARWGRSLPALRNPSALCRWPPGRRSRGRCAAPSSIPRHIRDRKRCRVRG